MTRSKGRSAVAAAAYQSGEKLFSEYDGEWKSGDHQERIIFKDILLPPHAPRSYADRQTLWNAVDASESRENAQTARRFIITLPKELSIEANIVLIRNYCETQFVDRGMIADIAVHFDDGDPPNPHAHILCTMRSMNEQGQWNDKTKTAYALDENGNRIMGKNGKWKRIRMDTVDWNDRKYCEIWRHEWEVQQNAALKQAGRTERVDMRSFKRQGIEFAPQVHLGPAAFALEKKGIRTDLGNHNKAVKQINNLFNSIRHKLKSLFDWLKELREVISDHEKIDSPGDFSLYQVLWAYYDLQKKERWNWNRYAQNKGGVNDLQEMAAACSFLRVNRIDTINDFARLLNNTSSKIKELDAARKAKEKRIRDIDAIIRADKTIRELNPILEKYNSIFFKGAKEKYGREHAAEIEQVKKAQRLLHKLNITQPIGKKALKAESSQLRGEVESMLSDLEGIKTEMERLMKIRSHIRKVLPEALTVKYEGGKKSFEDVAEEIQNQKELQQLLKQSADRAIQYGEERQQQQHPHTRQQEQQKGAL